MEPENFSEIFEYLLPLLTYFVQTLLYKRDQIVIDPVCFTRGHLCNNFHAIGLFRSIEGYVGNTLKRQNDARCYRPVRMGYLNISTADTVHPGTSGENY